MCARDLLSIFLNIFCLSKIRFEETNADSTSCKESIGQICIGGFARVMTMVKRLIAERTSENKNPIYLNIGDNFVGTLWYELFGWNVTQKLLNIEPIADATTLGNHEFDRGVEEVVHFLEHLISPVVVANLDDTNEPQMANKYNKSIVIEREDRKIGLIGALVVATLDISNPGNLKILDEIESVKAEAQRLKDEGIDIIIVLSHCGLLIDREMAQNTDDLIDVIVGGHSHSLLYTGDSVPGPDVPVDTYPIEYKTPSGHKTIIVQASAYTKYLGDLTVYFDDDGEIQSYEGNTIFMDNSIQPDADIVEQLKPWKEAVDAIGQRVVGEVKAMLYQKDCAVNECNIGNFVTDAFVDYFVAHEDYQVDDGWAYATVAITNAGGIRTNLPSGTVVYDDLFTTLPFANTLDVFELLGQDLLDVLQMSGDWFGRYNFLQFSGMKVMYNVTMDEGERVLSVEVLCRECRIPKYEKLDVTKWYRMIVPSFIGNGGNGFIMFRNKRNSQTIPQKDIEVVEKYFKKLSPVLQKKDGRITVLT